MKEQITSLFDITENSMQVYWNRADSLKNKMQNFQSWKEVAKLTPREIAYCVIYKTIPDKEIKKLNKHLERIENTVTNVAVMNYLLAVNYINNTSTPRHRNAADEIKFLCERLKIVLYEKQITDFFIAEMQQIFDCQNVAFKNLDAIFSTIQNNYPEIDHLTIEGKKWVNNWIEKPFETITTNRNKTLPYIFENGVYSRNTTFFDSGIIEVCNEFKQWMPTIKSYIIAFENWCASADLLDFLEGVNVVKYIDYVKLFYSKQYGEINNNLPMYCMGYYKAHGTPKDFFKKMNKNLFIPDYYDIEPIKADYINFMGIFNDKFTLYL